MRLAWEWVVPIIVMIFYVIGHVIKAREEAEGKANPKPAGPRGNSELDRFLEEIERLRRERAGMSTKEYAQQDDFEEVERPVSRPVIVQTPTIVLREVDAPVRRQEPIKPVAVAPPAAPSTMASRTVGITAPPTFRRARSLVATMALLRNPQTLASAIIMHEIFGPPKCRK